MLLSIFLFFSILFVSWFMVIFFSALSGCTCLFVWPLARFLGDYHPLFLSLVFSPGGSCSFPRFLFYFVSGGCNFSLSRLGVLFSFFFFGGWGVGFFYIFLERLVVGVGVGVGVLREITCK